MMMKVIAVACLCLLCLPEAWAQKKQSDRELAGLAGPVRVVREYRTFSQHRLKATEVLKLLENAAYRTITYNRGGDLLQEDNVWGLRYTYSYSADGLRVKTANGDRYPGSGNPNHLM